MDFTWQGMPLGQLCLPALRWTLRRHHLADDEPTRFLFRQYILSAWRVAQEFGALLDEVNPQAVVVFNGMFYPEATARWVARERGAARDHPRGGPAPYHRLLHHRRGHRLPDRHPGRISSFHAAQNARLDALPGTAPPGQLQHGRGALLAGNARPGRRHFWQRAGAVQTGGAGFHQRDLRHQPAALQRGLSAHVCLAGPGAGDQPEPTRRRSS